MTNQEQPCLSRRSVFRKEENIVSRQILDETILVPIAGNLADLQCIFALESVAAVIWDEIDGRNDLEAISSRIVAEFAVATDQAWADLEDFILSLHGAGLIREVAG